jgi:Mg2+-importing ATPase
MKTIGKLTRKANSDGLTAFWTQAPEVVCARLHCARSGLSSSDAEQRLADHGPNSDAETGPESILRAILRRLLEPLSLILLGAGLVSVATGDDIGGSLIVAILVVSIGLDTIQEGHAVRAADPALRLLDPILLGGSVNCSIAKIPSILHDKIDL